MKPSWYFLPFVPLYGFATLLRNWFYDIGILRTIDVGVPVISIGNITTGGTGKTPIVKNVAAHLSADGRRVAIISRGYGRSSIGTVVVSDGKNILTDVRSSGDEPMLLAEQLPNAIVIVDEDRVRGARKGIEEFGASVIVLDDGFQHRRIHRSQNIVLIDAQNSPFGTMLLPAGYRRELISSFKRADAVVITKSDNVNTAHDLFQHKELDSIIHKFSSSFLPTGIRHVFGGVQQSLEILTGCSVIALSGIARSESFQQSLLHCGVLVKKYFNYADHHTYVQSDIEKVIEALHITGADYIITTEKDAVRLKGFSVLLNQLPIVTLSMNVVLHQNETWGKYLLSGPGS